MQIPIITYHKLSRNRQKNHYIIEKEEFSQHIRYLCDNNYTTLLIEDYYQALKDTNEKVPSKSLIITFDDGHESDFQIALPILKKHNCKANFFITTDWIGRPGYMNDRQLKKLEENGMSVQTHGKTHAFLNQIKVYEVHAELAESKKTLEHILGKKISFISFPGGRFNKNVIDCAIDLEFTAMFSSVPCYLRKLDGIWLIGRYMITQRRKGSNFEEIINLGKFGKIKLRSGYFGKHLLKKILGNRAYYYLYSLRQGFFLKKE